MIEEAFALKCLRNISGVKALVRRAFYKCVFEGEMHFTNGVLSATGIDRAIHSAANCGKWKCDARILLGFEQIAFPYKDSVSEEACVAGRVVAPKLQDDTDQQTQTGIHNEDFNLR